MIATRKDSKSWERRENESSRAYGAFCFYRDLGLARSRQKVAEGVNRSHTLIQRWSVRHNWVARAEDYDAYLDARQREFTENARLDRALRHADLGRLMQSVGKKKLKSRSFRKRIAPREVVALVKTGVDIERDSLGDSREKHASGTTVNVNILGGIESAVQGARELIVNEILASLQGPQQVIVDASAVPVAVSSDPKQTG